MSQQLRGQIAVLILFYNKIEQTAECIDSFLPCGENIYVLNNGSAAVDYLALQNQFQLNSQVHFLDAGRNLGVSTGRNYLIQHTTEPWLFSVDNDIMVQPTNWLQSFTDYVEKNPKSKIVVPSLYNVHEQAYCEHLRIVLNKGQLHLETGIFDITNCFPGGASLIHRSVFETYGLFDDAMFVGFEDYEYAVRAMLSVDGPLQVSTIQSIQLLHDHQFQKSSTDKESVKQRYNEERLQASYNRLTEKFRVHFDHDWHWWTQNQIQVMTEPKWKIKFKQLIARIIGC